MPILITFNVGGDDQWLRQGIHGEASSPERVQRVIVENSDEMLRVVARMANLKVQRGKPYGGALAKAW